MNKYILYLSFFTDLTSKENQFRYTGTPGQLRTRVKALAGRSYCLEYTSLIVCDREENIIIDILTSKGLTFWKIDEIFSVLN